MKSFAFYFATLSMYKIYIILFHELLTHDGNKIFAVLCFIERDFSIFIIYYFLSSSE